MVSRFIEEQQRWSLAAVGHALVDTVLEEVCWVGGAHGDADIQGTSGTVSSRPLRGGGGGSLRGGGGSRAPWVGAAVRSNLRTGVCLTEIMAN